VNEAATEPDPAAAARAIVRRALDAMLATVNADGSPHASMVAMACRAEGAPIFLFSTLSAHTRNLARDPRAALLCLGPPAEGADNLDAARVTLLGRIEPSARADEDRARYLRRKPEAEMYAGFGDFSFFAMRIEHVHYVGGFARAKPLPAAEFARPVPPALATAEADILAHMNADHAEAIALYATKLAGAPAGAWTMTGIDAEGADLRAGARTARILFERPVPDAEAARRELVLLARKARGAGA
jgi:hypothetical protein